MIVDEQMIAGSRGTNGLCTLRRKPRGWRYSEYQEMVAQMQQEMQQSALLDDGKIKFSSTDRLFRDERSTARCGHSSIAVLAFTDLVPVLPESRQWWALQHQAAGYACRQTSMIATRLKPYPRIQAAFDRIAAENYAACGGYFESSESEKTVTEGYLSNLDSLGLKCGDVSLRLLCESIYPVETTSESLPLIYDDIADLLPLVECVGAAPVILFLSENSD